MKSLINFLFIFQIGILYTQNAIQKHLTGTWRFEKEVEFKKIDRDSILVYTSFCPIETENGTEYPDRIFKENNYYEFYFNKSESYTGFLKLKIKN